MLQIGVFILSLLTNAARKIYVSINFHENIFQHREAQIKRNGEPLRLDGGNFSGKLIATILKVRLKNIHEFNGQSSMRDSY